LVVEELLSPQALMVDLVEILFLAQSHLMVVVEEDIGMVEMV